MQLPIERQKGKKMFLLSPRREEKNNLNNEADFSDQWSP